jgi:hypothetical protein
MRKSNWEFNSLLRSQQPRNIQNFDVLATKSSAQKTLIFLSSRQFVGKICFNYQINAQFIYSIIIYTILYCSTCFEQYHAHLQEVKLYCYSIWYRLSP